MASASQQSRRLLTVTDTSISRSSAKGTMLTSTHGATATAATIVSRRP